MKCLFYISASIFAVSFCAFISTFLILASLTPTDVFLEKFVARPLTYFFIVGLWGILFSGGYNLWREVLKGEDK